MHAHHKDASIGVARALFAGMNAAEQAQIRAEAESRGVTALEIVRRSLDILIVEAGASAAGTRIPGRANP